MLHNWKLLSVVGLLALCMSCNDVGSFGSELENDDNLFKSLFTSDIALSTSTEKSDSIITYLNNLFNADFPCGSYEDPITGIHSSDMYFQVSLPFDQLGRLEDFKGVTEVDSVVFRMAFDTTRKFYGEAPVDVSYEIFVLDEKLDKTTYYSNYQPSFIPRSLGSVEDLNVSVDSTVASVEPVGELVDTLPFIPHIRIPMNKSFGDDLVRNDTSVFRDNNLLQEELFGFYLRSNNPAKALLYYDINESISGIHVYYSRNGVGNKAVFPIRSELITAVKYDHNFENTIAENVIEGSNDSLIVVQSMGALNGRLEFGDLSALDNTIVSNALLYISVDIDQDPAGLDFKPINQLGLFDEDNNEPIADLAPGRFNSDISFDGRIRQDSSDQYVYRFIITNYMQDLVNGEASSTLRLVSTSQNFEANRSVLFNEKSSHPPRLEVLYTPNK